MLEVVKVSIKVGLILSGNLHLLRQKAIKIFNVDASLYSMLAVRVIGMILAAVNKVIGLSLQHNETPRKLGPYPSKLL